MLTRDGREGTRVAEGVLKAMREETKHGNGGGQELTAGL